MSYRSLESAGEGGENQGVEGHNDDVSLNFAHIDGPLVDDLFDGGTSNQKQPRQPHERSAEGGLLMTWRSPGWQLPSLPSDLRLSSFQPLDELEGRQQCGGCGKSQHYFCFNCLVPLTPPLSTPSLSLPFHLTIILHRLERRSMSTGMHAAILANQSTEVYDWAHVSELPTLSATDSVVLFPSPKARQLADVDLAAIRNVVVVDSKWKGASAILSLPQISHLPHIRLTSIRTSFWRYHTRGVAEEAVSTIEAIWWLCRSWHALQQKQQCCGQGGDEEQRRGGGDNGGGRREEDGSHKDNVQEEEEEGGEEEGGAKGVNHLIGSKSVGGRGGEGRVGQLSGCHCFDDLLWYFAYCHRRIQQLG